MDKKFVCSADGRRFATKQALAQHRQASHGTPGQNGRAKPQPKRVNPPPVRATSKGAGREDYRDVLVAQPQRVVGDSGTDMASVSGLDRLFHTDSLTTLAPGSVVVDFLVVPSNFKRLAKVASAFQRISYVTLEFLVEPQLGSAASGGYVAGFVSDPDDAIVTLDQLTATRGSVTTKWWQASRVVARLPARTYFTSHGVELREFSPGRFVLMVDGKCTQTGSLTIFCRWSARLSGAILEPPASKQVTLPYPIWIRNGHQGVWAKVPTSVDPSGWSDKKDHIIGEGAASGSSYRLSAAVAIVKPNDHSLALHHWLYVQDSNSVFLAVNGPADYYAAAYEIDNFILDAGTVVQKYGTSAVSGEAEVASSLGSEAMTPGLEKCLRDLAKLPNLLETFLQSLNASHQQSQDQEGTSRSRGSSCSMEFLRE